MQKYSPRVEICRICLDIIPPSSDCYHGRKDDSFLCVSCYHLLRNLNLVKPVTLEDLLKEIDAIFDVDIL